MRDQSKTLLRTCAVLCVPRTLCGALLALRAKLPFFRRSSFILHFYIARLTFISNALRVLRPSGERESGSYSGTRHGTAYKSGPRKSARRGNPKGPGDAAGRSGKSFLFCISVRVPWNPLAGRYGLEREEHRSCGGVRTFPADLENPGEGYVELSGRFVPISAAGLQGE